MKFQTLYGGDTFEISVRKLPDAQGVQRLEVSLTNAEESRQYQVDVLGQQSDRWTFRLGSAIEDFIVFCKDETSLVEWKNQLFSVEFLSRRTGSHASGGSDEVGRETAQKAEMPGKIIRLLKHVGDPVEAGEGVVVVEAMKMQNEIGSPGKGIISVCDLEEGASVSAGDVLFEIE